MSSTSTGQILGEISRVVGSDHVITDAAQMAVAQTSTYKTSKHILAIVEPGTAEQVQAVVNTANHHQTPIHVYSTGKNWGYGSRIPPTDHCILVDLSRLNKILEYDQDLGYVVVEPGVTQAQLHEFLISRQSPFSLSTTGSARDTSIIGNICERGVGTGPYGFRSHFVSNLEILLPSGKFMHTGFGRFDNSKAANTYPEGIGPSFYDIFLQSNFGIITKLTMFLAPTPNFSQVIDISIATDQDLPKYLKLLHQYNFFSSSKKLIVIRKDLQFLLLKTQYPWAAAGNQTPLPAAVAAQLKQKYAINYAWKAIAVIYGYSRQEVAAQIAYFKSLAKNLDGVNISPLYTDNTLGNEPRNLSDSVYWRMKTKPPTIKNPDTDGCGLIRLSIAVPFTSDDIEAVIQTMTRVLARFKYEPFIEAHCISDRAAVVIAPIIFDRTVLGEDDNALNCHDALLKQLIAQGYYPYRDNGRAMSLLPKSSDSYDEFQQSLKTAIDPGNIFSPGRYQS